jgi:VanZ family protein
MLLSWFDTRHARICLVIALIAISILSLMPSQAVPAGSGWDKFDHWAAFFTLSLLASHAFPQRAFWQIALALLGYGVGIEIAQSFRPDRFADVMDIVADVIGIVIYWLIQSVGIAFAGSRPSTD